MEQVKREYGPRGLAILAINMEETRAAVTAWVKRHTVTTTVLLDPTGAVNRAYRVVGTPTVVVVGRDGALVGKALSVKEWTGPAGRALLEAMLAR